MNDNEPREDVETAPTTSPTGALAAGTRVDERFVVEALAGQGGMGQVYRARDARTGQRVALKLLRGLPAPEALLRFEREALLLSSLRHPGLVAHVAHGATEQGQSYLVMEWLEGEELSRRLAREPLSLGESLALVRRVAEALAHAHARGVVHRDLKPSNLFLRGGRPEDAVVLDFGLARHARPSLQAVTRSHTVVGTPGYMAPEQAASQAEILPAADIFSLGCVLYECLTGRPPFEAPHFAAALAKILFTEPVPPRVLRPELPEALEALVLRMLAKAPGQRPAHAAALGEALASLALTPSESGGELLPRLSGLGGAERQLVSVLLVSPPPGDGAPQPGPGADLHPVLHAMLVPQGGRVERLADGSWVATLVPVRGTATDLAALAARCALALKERWPEAAVVLVTGLSVLDAHLPVGEAMDKAGRLLRGTEAVPSSAVVMDEVTAGLLGATFQLNPSGSGAFLLRSERLGVDTSRPLLGKPTPCVGREQELALLEACFVTCLEESNARALLVTAPPGVGKSRLRHEFLRRLGLKESAPLVLVGRGDPMHKGVSQGLLGQMLRELCGVPEGAALETKRALLLRRVSRHLPEAQASEVAAFLGELCAIAFPEEASPRLRAAREDPQVMGIQMGRALVAFLEAECARGPVLLVLEDLHWSDALTVALVDRLLRELSERPFMVLALARPEVKQLFPGLWGRALQELSLNGLSRKACARLVREVLGAEVPESVVRRAVEQSDGNVLFLEELIRMVAEGRQERVPETVLAVLQTRLLRMESGARQTLLVASIFGRVFWPGGVGALSGRAAEDSAVKAHLRLLVEEEVIEAVADSRFPGEPEYRFRHALVRDAAYGLLAEGFRVVGHRAAGAWLERMGEPDALEIALHHQLGQRPARAVEFYAQAAERFFAHDDFPGTRRCVQAALDCGPRADMPPRLRAIEALLSLWLEPAPRTLALGIPVLEELPAGGMLWCRLLGGLILGATLGGEHAQTRRLSALLLSTRPEPEASAMYIEALASMCPTLFWFGRGGDMGALLERARPLEALSGERRTMARGLLQMIECQYLGLIQGRPWHALRLAELSLRDSRETGMERSVYLACSVVGWLRFELGDVASAIRLTREAWTGALHHSQWFLAYQARGYLMHTLAFSDEPAHWREAVALAREEPASGMVIPVIQGLSEVISALVLLMHGGAEEAEQRSRRACEMLAPFAPLLGFACAVLSRCLLRRGRLEEARAQAVSGVEWTERSGASTYWRFVQLSLAEVRFALGEETEGDATLRALVDRVRLLAGEIPEPEVRARFLSQVPDNARALALARERWGEAPA
ncbi:protein kinase domain-containing protein [Melittangium boletus]|uniref:serine/threonine-protein kinase n=1 Tax=Melittangium boletus TaxID=83453 RepID=UPI003DA6402D